MLSWLIGQGKQLELFVAFIEDVLPRMPPKNKDSIYLLVNIANEMDNVATECRNIVVKGVKFVAHSNLILSTLTLF